MTSAILCEARILREFKTKKADTVWPAYEGWDKLEPCGGVVTFEVRPGYEPYMGGADAKIEVEATCSRCRAPYYPGAFIVSGGSQVEKLLTRALTEFVGRWQCSSQRPYREYAPGQHVNFESNGVEYAGRISSTPFDDPSLEMRRLKVMIETPGERIDPTRVVEISVEAIRA